MQPNGTVTPKTSTPASLCKLALTFTIVGGLGFAAFFLGTNANTAVSDSNMGHLGGALFTAAAILIGLGTVLVCGLIKISAALANTKMGKDILAIFFPEVVAVILIAGYAMMDKAGLTKSEQDNILLIGGAIFYVCATIYYSINLHRYKNRRQF